MTTEEEFIRQAQVDWGDDRSLDFRINDMESALEACYMNGSYDDIGGDVDAPCGAFYRVERWVLVTNDQGQNTVHTFGDDDEAAREMERLNVEYSEWCDD